MASMEDGGFVAVFQYLVRDEVEAGGASVWEFPNDVLDFT